MCLYGTNNIMEFFDEYKNEVVLLLGKNAIGKSSIIDIITYIL
jgi:ABC-type cobalamin/Fe3+-siderophores transport system ATPase subunit